MAVGGEVGADTSMGTVGSSTSGNSALDNDVVDNAGIDVELGSLSVGLQVDQKLAHGLKGLLGPSSLSVFELLALSVTSNTSGVPTERNNLFVLQTVVHIVNGRLELQALGGAGHFVSVLIMSSQVRDSGLCRYKGKGKTRI